MKPIISAIQLLALAGVGLGFSANTFADSPPESRLRIIIETDAGGDPDDEQSLVRFLLYVNEWDVEGIIANRAQTRLGENKNPERTGLGVVRRLIRAYGECYANLRLHDLRYPDPQALQARTVAGYDDTDEGVKLIMAAVDRDDPRPIWYADWGTDKGGAVNNLKRALDRVLKERGQEGYARFKNKLRVICHGNIFGEHTTKRESPFPLFLDTFRPEMDGKRWYHRFSALTATAGGFDLKRDVLTNHGPLGALYPTNTTHPQKEGDTMTFLHLVPTGLSDPEQPGWGGWSGRFGLNPEFYGRPCYWADQKDAWQGVLSRDNILKRWAVHLQNDFRARLDWCVRPVKGANHPPHVVIRGDHGLGVIRLSPPAGAQLVLDAASSGDPDGDQLTFEWFVYSEAGTYRGAVQVENADNVNPTVYIPPDAVGKETHLIVAVTDQGQPPLTRYRRIIITAQEPIPMTSRDCRPRASRLAARPRSCVTIR
jgi:Cellulose-binding Sde182, nucleoside hydrolase-like domain/Cellulose-binding protein Sde0182, C-terminal domain